MLELDDIQHFLWARPRALAARYGFLTFRQATGGRAWLSGIIDKVGTGQVVGSAGAIDARRSSETREPTTRIIGSVG